MISPLASSSLTAINPVSIGKNRKGVSDQGDDKGKIEADEETVRIVGEAFQKDDPACYYQLEFKDL